MCHNIDTNYFITFNIMSDGKKGGCGCGGCKLTDDGKKGGGCCGCGK